MQESSDQFQALSRARLKHRINQINLEIAMKTYNVGRDNHKIINLLAHYNLVHLVPPSDLITAYKVIDFGRFFTIYNTKKAILSIWK